MISCNSFDFFHPVVTLHAGSGNSTAGANCSIRIAADGETLYHVGDTVLFLDMKWIGELNSIDVAMLPIGDNFTMGIDDAAAIAVDSLKAKLALQMHYNTFDLIKVDPHAFAKKVRAIGARAKVPAVGETIEIAERSHARLSAPCLSVAVLLRGFAMGAGEGFHQMAGRIESRPQRHFPDRQ